MSPDLENEPRTASPSRPSGFGRLLKDAREARGLTLDALAEITRIRLRYLAALEAEDWDTLPEGVIGRGFVRVVAREVGVPPEDLLRRYLAARGGEDAEPSHALPEADWRVDLRGGRRGGRRAVLLGVGAVAAVVVGLGLWDSLVSVAPAPPSVAPAPAPAPEPAAPPVPEPAPVAAPVAAPEPAPAPEPGVEPPPGVRLEIQAVERVWVRVTVDGGAPEDRVLKPGEQLRFDGEKGLGVKLGNAGGVRLTWNGQALRVPGLDGQVVSLSFPEAAEALRP